MKVKISFCVFFILSAYMRKFWYWCFWLETKEILIFIDMLITIYSLVTIDLINVFYTWLIIGDLINIYWPSLPSTDFDFLWWWDEIFEHMWRYRIFYWDTYLVPEMSIDRFPLEHGKKGKNLYKKWKNIHTYSAYDGKSSKKMKGGSRRSVSLKKFLYKQRGRKKSSQQVLNRRQEAFRDHTDSHFAHPWRNGKIDRPLSNF